MTATVEVWRVEDERGRGPYGTKVADLPWHVRVLLTDAPYVSVAAAAGACSWSTRRTPCPWDDGLDGAIGEKLRFGCLTRKLAVEWFGREPLDRMAGWGFRLRRLEVPREHVRFGDSGLQCAFRRELARKLP